jgi:hypothetical protein
VDEHDQKIAEVVARIEALEGIVSNLADNVLKLESILNSIAESLDANDLED